MDARPAQRQELIWILDRDMVRATLGWAPLERLSLQFKLEEARDKYGTRLNSGGPNSMRVSFTCVPQCSTAV